MPRTQPRFKSEEWQVIYDLTPNGPWCSAADPEWGCLCTRLPGHTGRHAAGDGDWIVAVWH